MTNRGVDPVLATVAADFWLRTGLPDAFPRDIVRGISIALPVPVTLLPRLTLCEVRRRLERIGVPTSLPCGDRAVHGCVVAWRGVGWMFIEASDPSDERRFSIAHEAAHYLLDYEEPRERAIRRLGPAIADVLDGLRPPTVDERVHGWLSNCPVGPQVHLLEEEPGTFGRPGVWRAENQADALALELLAPAQTVLALLADSGTGSYRDAVALAQRLLLETFGLPAGVVPAYARRLAEAGTGGPSLRDALGLR